MSALLVVAACSSSPEGMLEELATAIDEGNLLRFEALVDLDALVMDFATQMRAEFERMSDDTFGDAEWAEVSGPALLSTGIEIRTAVRERRLLDAILGDVLFLSVLLPGDPGGDLPAAVQEPSVEVEEIYHEGRTALVVLRYAHALDQGTRTVDLRLERGETGWRVVGLDRAGSYWEWIGLL